MTTTVDDRYVEIEQFVYSETALLDNRRFTNWLALFTADARYRVAVRDIVGDGRQAGYEVVEKQLCNDDREFLKMRVARLERNLGACERPPSLTRRLVTNLEIDRTDNGWQAHVNFAVYQARMAQDWLVGERTDQLIVTEAGLRIRHRNVLLDYIVVPRTLTVLL
ncbi:aromatic-ring-hydroxylating dioxygenase subunit beta [Nocardia gipuzkoensis]|uniref:aromatic-ring-hydroxylating dioxygenase subunit beta n=1 Tax=Nocardia gipuzkoensis TaxID=2749991 RepID=UPI00237D6C0D|nr:aromatic-ring-hydroxylating dioxygenase subunit beta [Nocardia gipuzkoensis]MDE1675304.1 aromatic-ring-hydroxylating dioxygenase subunit beta [Nocardia gipuzkoensis]